jgi:osmotically-inducible protein OsmY
MADRYEDFDRNRDRERGRDAGQRFEDYRRESRGEEYGQGGREYDRDREYGREERGWGGREGYGSESRYRGGFGAQSSEYDRGREEWRWRDRPGSAGQGVGGGMGTYSGQDWSQRQGSWGGGMGEGFGRGGERGYGERGYSERGGYQGMYGQGYGQEGYGAAGRSVSETWRGGAWGGASTYAGQGTTGRFTGRGPKGYRRSDERIREDVCDRLTQHPDVDASEIEVQVNNGEVTLTGSVEDRSQKRMAEDMVENLSGVREVHNQLRVSKGILQRTGEALGLGGREEGRTTGTTTTTGRQAEPTTARR